MGATKLAGCATGDARQQDDPLSSLCDATAGYVYCMTLQCDTNPQDQTSSKTVFYLLVSS
jgi:hypothetical protein